MQKGGGIHCLQAGRLNLTHTRVVDNYAGVGGGGLYVMVVVVWWWWWRRRRWHQVIIVL